MSNSDVSIENLVRILKRRADEQFGAVRATELEVEIQQMAAELQSLRNATMEPGDEP
jgi:hypothetical protein